MAAVRSVRSERVCPLRGPRRRALARDGPQMRLGPSMWTISCAGRAPRLCHKRAMRPRARTPERRPACLVFRRRRAVARPGARSGPRAPVSCVRGAALLVVPLNLLPPAAVSAPAATATDAASHWPATLQVPTGHLGWYCSRETDNGRLTVDSFLLTRLALAAQLAVRSQTMDGCGPLCAQIWKSE